MATILQQLSEGQGSRPAKGKAEELSRSDRRLLPSSSLRVFYNRARKGYAVHSRDLLELSKYADPDESVELPAVAA